nr:MAG TPA: hypothetical protein [Caudoviricetes sp.]DAT61105.1 MAG TPA: hypothetical protein [Caudoviricetes sp.]
MQSFCSLQPLKLGWRKDARLQSYVPGCKMLFCFCVFVI